MDKVIRKSEAERSRASVTELLITHNHESKGKPPTLDYLVKEAFTFLDAGVDTAGRTLIAAVHYILQDQEIKKKLINELDEASDAWSSGDAEVDVRKLANLPYLVILLTFFLPSSLLSFVYLRIRDAHNCLECGYQRSTSNMASHPGIFTPCCSP